MYKQILNNNFFINTYRRNKISIESSSIKVLNLLVNFILNFFIINNLGLSGAGLIFTCLNLNLILLVLGNLGFQRSVVKFISQLLTNNDFGKINQLIDFSMNLTIIISCALSFIFLLLTPILNKFVFQGFSFDLVLILFLLSLPFSLINHTNTYIIQGLGYPVFAIVFNILLIPALWLLFLYIIPISSPVYYAIAYLCVSIFVLILSRKLRINIWKSKIGNQFDNLKNKFIFQRRSFINLSFKTWQVTVLSVFTARVSELLVGVFGTPSDVTIFSTSYKLSMVLLVTLIGANQSIANSVAALHKQKKINSIKNISNETTKFMLLFSLPLFIFMILKPEFLLGLFSEELTGSGNILRFLAIANMSKLILGANETILSMCGYEKFLFKAFLFTFLISLALNLVLLPKIGIIGAASSVLIANVLNEIILKIKVDSFIKNESNNILS